MPNTKNAIGYPNADGSFSEIANNNPKYDGINAADVSFDNTGTGMSATNVQGAIVEVNSKTSNISTSGRVSLNDYTSSNMYTLPADGYIVANSASVSSGVIQVMMETRNRTGIGCIFMNITGTYQTQCVFARKGMYAYVQSKATGTDVAFIPLDSY